MKCGLCLFEDAITEPVRVREHGYRWSQQIYRLCAKCKKHWHGGFKYANKKPVDQDGN